MPVGYDRDRALVGDRLTEVVCVVGGVGHDHLGGQAFDQWPCLGRVALLAGGQDEAHGAA